MSQHQNKINTDNQKRLCKQHDIQQENSDIINNQVQDQIDTQQSKKGVEQNKVLPNIFTPETELEAQQNYINIDSNIETPANVDNQFETKKETLRSESPTHSSQQFQTIVNSEAESPTELPKKVNILQPIAPQKQQILQVVSPLYEHHDANNFIPSPDPDQNLGLHMEDLQLSDEDDVEDPNILESLVYRHVQDSHTVERLDKIIDEANAQVMPPKPVSTVQNLFKNGVGSIFDFQRKSQCNSKNSSFASNQSFRTDQTAFKQEGADHGQTRESVISQAFSEIGDHLCIDDMFQDELSKINDTQESIEKSQSLDKEDKDTISEQKSQQKSESKLDIKSAAIGKNLFIDDEEKLPEKKKSIFAGIFKRKQ
ncbi:hypothetical protein SS50377_22003 [Spironucleus salmonicida]|uniref:Uncharacterized protein n=1 Tax=Spironucleus salmonicida TaxID=348837 RepID=V6LMB4_9EUKA|nr:hypothetical protein SS50377_22003 [Spironucleus salmonicida]|eukprot:EST45832.1 Hypothetical protein SS50377_14407 [Spironucleus salmonicida]